jgi:hypothetical protein
MSLLDKAFTDRIALGLAANGGLGAVLVDESTLPEPGDMLVVYENDGDPDNIKRAHWVPFTGDSGALATAEEALAAASDANAAAVAAQSTADSAQSSLTAHIGSGGAAHALASGSAAGFLASADFTKLAGIESGAQVVSAAHVLTALAAAAGDVSVNSHKITNLATPAAGNDATNKTYVDAIVTASRVLAALALAGGDIDVHGQIVRNAGGPLISTDLATKGYADAIAAAAVPKTLWDANSLVIADADDTPIVLAVPASTIVARKATGGIVAATPSEVAAILGLTTFSIATDIAPLHRWIMSPSYVTQSGGLVDSINDQGSSAKNFTQTGTPRAPLGTDADGKSYLALDGSNDFYQAGAVADWKFLNDGSPWTIAIVYQRTAAITAREPLLDTTSGATGNTGLNVMLAYTSATVQGPSATMLRGVSTTSVWAVMSRVLNTNKEVLIIRYSGDNTPGAVLGDQVGNPMDVLLSRNGTLRGYGKHASANPPNNANPSFTLTLGKLANAAEYSAAHIYEVIADNKLWSSRQQSGAEDALRQAYAITGL